MDSNFNFKHKIGLNDSMIEFTKMCILLSMSEFPKNRYEEAKLIKNKFDEKYSGSWNCVIYKIGNGDQYSNYHTYFINVDYQGNTFIIWKF